MIGYLNKFITRFNKNYVNFTTNVSVRKLTKIAIFNLKILGIEKLHRKNMLHESFETSELDGVLVFSFGVRFFRHHNKCCKTEKTQEIENSVIFCSAGNQSNYLIFVQKYFCVIKMPNEFIFSVNHFDECSF